MTSLALSVLDLIPVRDVQTTAQALRASVELARTADRLGYRRYWVAEHHNTRAVASTNPPVLIALLASATERIRVGSGGVMLPNHAPLVVAEQFALLEAAHPGRIDLGIGRAPGTDPVTNWVLRHGMEEGAAVQRFENDVTEVMAMMHPDGAAISLPAGGGRPARHQALLATPHAVDSPPVWLLGSSDYSARLAAKLGLPYVFAHHFAGQGTAEALSLYRHGWRLAEHPGSPTTFLTVNVAVAPTTEEAERLARPHLLSMIALRTGGEFGPQALVEDAAETTLSVTHDHMAGAFTQPWVVGDPETAAARLRALAAEHGVDEVMVHPVAGATRSDPADRSPAREQTLELLRQAL
ncbi:LLM class flavin-dependent oxidoreductase [Auraticoccus monumenti]|uniref:Luciferase family oxidoreductase, group 1 n=1 Tax=Auraticoccus monumenti TaxID=675864 RepID=A0A1G7AI31_9ACTN|nr:LLM class flavin-dependent oxidoreductase [Auraticoccus monumenti]SDE14363.1 luciferase family oxidoreductase, group 1 [Auraticoccus monumenti]